MSTDIDYAMDQDMLRAFMDRVHQDLTQDLREMKGAGEIKSYRMGWRSCAWTYPASGPVSLSAPDHQSFDDMDWEEDTHVAVAPTPAILAGKLFGRVLDANRLVVRDGYDLCAAFRHEPDVATRLVQVKQRRGEDMGCLRATVKGAGRRIIEGRPLQEPVHEDLAHDPWGEFVSKTTSGEPSSFESVRKPDNGVFPREPPFQFAVGGRLFRMAAKVVAEQKVATQLGGVLGADVKVMVGQLRGRSKRVSPRHSLVSFKCIADGRESFDDIFELIVLFDDDIDVNDRLGGQTGYRRAPNVLDTSAQRS